MKHVIWSDMDIINDESLEYAKETLLVVGSFYFPYLVGKLGIL